MRRIVYSLVIVCSALAAGNCTNPQVELQQMDAIKANEEALTELRTYVGDLESEIDSLRSVALKQDTALRLIVDFTGAQVPSYRR